MGQGGTETDTSVRTNTGVWTENSAKDNTDTGAEKQKKIQEMKELYTARSVRCKNPTDHAEYKRLVLSWNRSDNSRAALSLPICDAGGALLSSAGCDAENVGQNQNILACNVGEGASSLPFCDEESFQVLSIKDEISEFMFLGLRMLSGVSEKEFSDRFGIPVDAVYGEPLERLLSLKLLRRENGRIFLTQRGLDLSNPVMAEFLL